MEDNEGSDNKNISILSVGIEPTTLGLLAPRSNQLSYESLLATVAASSDLDQITFFVLVVCDD